MTTIINFHTGTSDKLGVTKITHQGLSGTNFCVHADKKASMVLLCLFIENEEIKIAMQHTDSLWHIFLAGDYSEQKYGYRVLGDGFNEHKLLLDPYSTMIDKKPNYLTDLSYNYADDIDNGLTAPKGIIPPLAEFSLNKDVSPKIDDKDLIIYELHVKGFSQLNENLPENLRGTYLGLVEQHNLDYFKSLGINAIELLPIHFKVDEYFLQQRNLPNFYGYNSLSYFSLEPDYFSNTQYKFIDDEVRYMVAKLHENNIKVILDVVFNHTAEGEIGKFVHSLQGFDKNYYLTVDGVYQNYSGCGNTVDCDYEYSTKLVVDSLEYLVTNFHIDGFRFDLATDLGREKTTFSQNAKLLTKITTSKILQDIILIAEPWDIGINGYQLGNFPDRFMEWNDTFRIDVRKFWLQKSLNIGQFITKFCGSHYIFKKPTKSINYITSHDGFTLQDLVSYSYKHNELNCENNLDGSSDDQNFNFGIEGETTNSSVLQKRLFIKQSLLASLLLAKGIPMLQSGDEIGHSKQGNNNSYCQDNKINWLDWNAADAEFLKYTKFLIAVRKKLSNVMIDRFFTATDVAWYNNDLSPMTTGDWSMDMVLAHVIDNNSLLIVCHKKENTKFKLPEGRWMDTLNNCCYENEFIVKNPGVYLLMDKK